MTRISAIVAGAGSGTRLGSCVPKALVTIAGKPLVVHAIGGLNAAGVSDVVVTIPQGHEADFSKAINKAGLSARLVVGGATRQASVAKGLAAVDSDFVLVHDAARALTPPSVIETIIRALRNGHNAVVPALPVIDTIKEVAPHPADLPNNSASTSEIKVESVVGTLDRSLLRAMQTPQGFSTDVLRKAHEANRSRARDEASAASDDATLVELLGEEVVLVPGSPESMKVTTPWDLDVAEMIVARRLAELKKIKES